MKFTIEQKTLLKHLQKICIILTKNIEIPIINNILIDVQKNVLFLTCTNLEVEIVTKIILLFPYKIGQITVSGRKFLNICRSLSSRAIIDVYLKINKLIIKSNNSIFSLCTLSADSFPKFLKNDSFIKTSFSMQEKLLKYIIVSTYFCMAKQDVRNYLNGILLEIKNKKISTVATDGYRLAICNISFENFLKEFSIIIPRKSIIELIKILNYSNNKLLLHIYEQNIFIYGENLIFVTKLIDGEFPDYSNILLNKRNKIIEINTKLLRDSISRISILSNSQFKGISFNIYDNQIKITSNNQLDELAEETIKLHYQNNLNKIEFSFNVNYILDILSIIRGENVRFILNNSISGIHIEDTVKNFSKYVIMPLQI